MMLLTKAEKDKLIANHRANVGREETTPHKPVVKLFTPWAGATWLLSELDPATNIAFGLCDLGMGAPEIGYVSLDEITELRGPGGLLVERDRWFRTSKTIVQHAEEARKIGRIET